MNLLSKYILILLLSLSYLQAGFAFELDRRWVRDFNQTTQKNIPVSIQTPYFHNESIVFGDLKALRFVHPKWGHQTGQILIDKGLSGPNLGIQDYLFGSSLNGHFYSINLSEKKILWKTNLKSLLTAKPLLNDGLLYVLTQDQKLYAIQASSGEIVWNFQADSLFSEKTDLLAYKPVLHNSSIYFGLSNGTIYQLNKKSGLLQKSFFVLGKDNLKAPSSELQLLQIKIQNKLTDNSFEYKKDHFLFSSKEGQIYNTSIQSNTLTKTSKSNLAIYFIPKSLNGSSVLGYSLDGKLFTYNLESHKLTPVDQRLTGSTFAQPAIISFSNKVKRLYFVSQNSVLSSWRFSY